MKKLLLLLLLVGCASKPSTVTEIPKQEVQEYTCAAFTPHGTYAHWYGYYKNDEEAMADAVTVNDRLIKEKAIPDTCVPVCYSESNPQNMIFPKAKASPCDEIDASNKEGRENKALCQIGECVQSGKCK